MTFESLTDEQIGVASGRARRRERKERKAIPAQRARRATPARTGEKGEKGDPGRDAPQEAVLYTAQTLNDAQKAQARENIGAADEDDS